MGGSKRNEPASNGYDKSNCALGNSNGQRGNLDRPVGFRNVVAPAVEIPHPSQYMSLEPYSTHGLNARTGELRRILGISLEAHSNSPPPISLGELKRAKDNLEETSLEAGARAKSVQGDLLNLASYWNIISTKHQRNEIQLNDKSSKLTGFKTGSQLYQNSSDLRYQRLEDRMKIGAPNKRARSSIAETRATSPYSIPTALPLRQGIMGVKDKAVPVDKDKNLLRACSEVTDDRTGAIDVLPAGMEWEKKMKRKRSLLATPSQPTSNRMNLDGEQELKHPTNLRVRKESYPRSSDCLGFRTGLSNGNAECSNSQPSAGFPRIIPRIELTNGFLSNDRRERVTTKGNNKLNICEDAQLGSQSALPKGKASRASRTNLNVVMSSSTPNFACASVATIDGAKWGGGQRSKGKNSHTRKANVKSPISSSDDIIQTDISSIAPIVQSSGLSFNRGNIPKSTTHLKLKHESINEKEELERRIGSSGIETGKVNVPPKLATFVLPTKKKEIGDGIRRQGRTGRGSLQSKGMLEGLETKPNKSGRHSSDQPDSRAGRSPSKKASDRKGSIHPGQNINRASSELAGESDDDREELLAAAKAAGNIGCPKRSGQFWELMEPFFSPVKSEDFTLLKHQAIEDTNQSVPLHISQQVSHVNGQIEEMLQTKKIIPLSQRLLSAFILEVEIEMMGSNLKAGDSCECFPYSHEFTKLPSEFHNNTSCNGFSSHSKFNSSDHLLQENGLLVNSNYRNAGVVYSEFMQDKLNHEQFENMSLDDKVLLELHSIGIYPDSTTDIAEGGDDEIDKALSELKITLHEQMAKKNSQLCRLEKVIQEHRESELRNLEQLAMNKLVEMAYNRLLGGRHKSGSSKVSKQLSMAFAKRTLDRCHKFEETGQSYFWEPILRDVLFSKYMHGNDMHGNGTKGADVINPEIAPNVNAEVHNPQFDSQALASNVSPNMVERRGSVLNINRSQLDPYQGLTHFPNQTLIENDQLIDKGKRKEVLLNDVVNTNTTLTNGSKWKKTDKDTKDLLTKNCTKKSGTSRSERKTKSKPKQKITQLSSSNIGFERIPETTNQSPKIISENAPTSTEKSAHDLSKEMENNNIFSENIDDLDELGGQGEDIGSWLNVDDDSLQDNDLVGLKIPMDDLSDIKLTF